MKSLRVPVVALLSTLIGGCVITNANTMSIVDDGAILTIASTGKGLMPGMCGPYIGSTTETYAIIRLVGEKDRYGAGEFSFVDENGRPREFITQPSGRISIDRNNGTVVLDIESNGKKLPLNGKYEFTVAAPTATKQ